ncbi:MAG TPA: HK97 family phage prohead protease [Clostridia bacterium]
MENKTVDKREIRTVPLTELRVQSDGERPVIEGHASVFDSWSETLGGIFPFKEKVRKGAFARSIEKDDIRALFNHSPDYVLGRNKARTLELMEDDKGLLVRIFPPDTQWARDLTVSISRGDISQMSFGFTVIKDEWSSQDKQDVRELIEVKLYDVSPVTFPAYTQTDVGVKAMREYESYLAEKRSAEESINTKLQEKKRLENLKNRFKLM